MRDPSPYAGQTVKLRPDAAELGGQRAEVIDWYDRISEGVSWRDSPGDPRTQNYTIRRALGGLPVDDDVLFARIDGMGQLVHQSEIEGAPAAVKAGQPCPTCGQTVKGG